MLNFRLILKRTSIDLLGPVFFLASACSCSHLNSSGSVSSGVDPYAPAAPELTQEDTSESDQDDRASANNDKQGKSASNVGSEDPVIVDSMTSEGETPSQATQDYIDAFNDQPDYKPGKSANRNDSDESENKQGDGAEKMVVNISRINLRSEPNRYSKIVGELRKGDVIMVDIDQNTGWGKISDGKYIRARHLKSAP